MPRLHTEEIWHTPVRTYTVCLHDFIQFDIIELKQANTSSFKCASAFC